MSSSGGNLRSYLIPLEEINRATENFSPHRCIGGGGFGLVYRGQLSERWQNCKVAIKRLDQKSRQGEPEFRTELDMIFRFHHENIISFVGYCDEGNEMIIVYEYAMKGSLDNHLAEQDKRRCITWTQRLKICLGAAEGLNYLHSGLGEYKRVIHRDFKSANILLDDNLVAKISDFGLSKYGRRNHPHTEVHTKVSGTWCYVDPSYNESGILRKESDVYSFGVVMFEILSGMLVHCPRSIGNYKPKSLMNFVRGYKDNELHKLIDPYIKDQINGHSLETFKKIAYQCINMNSNERPMMDVVILRIKEALSIQENVASLVENVIEDIGFSHGIPVVGLTIYKCLLNQKHLEAETTIVFDRLIQIIVSTIWVQDHNNLMAYWLSNASTLLFLIQKSLKLDDATSVSNPPPPTSLLARMTMGFGSFLSSVGLVEAEAALMVVQEVEAKNPALHFKQQLTENVEKVYGIICDNLKKELKPLLALCIQAPATSVREDSQFNHWQDIVGCLNTLLNTLKENFVPTIIVRSIFAQIFSYINVQLFNSFLVCRECCTYNNGQYVNDGLKKLEQWCHEAKEEYAGSAWDELKHIRHAISFLTIHQKYRISKDEITNDLCPFLSIEQLKRLHDYYSDGNYNTRSISPDVISSISMPVLIAELSNNASSYSFLLEDNSSISFSVDDLSTSLQVKDFTNVKPAVELSKYGALDFLYS